MQIHVPQQRLVGLGVNGGVVHWIRDFLPDRPLRVIAGTGAATGDNFPTAAFLRVHNELIDHANSSQLLCCTVIVREDLYFNRVLTLLNCSLEINVSKTKELISPNSKDLLQPIMIKS